MFDDIGCNTALDIVSGINTINEFDDAQEAVIINYEREPIYLHISSKGGEVSYGNAIISAIESSDTPIIAFGSGMIASMSLLVFVSCHYRIAHRLNRFMVHNVAYDMSGNIREHEETKEEIDILEKMYNNQLMERTHFSMEKLREIRTLKKDYYFSSNEALRLGVVDEVLKAPEIKV